MLNIINESKENYPLQQPSSSLFNNRNCGVTSTKNQLQQQNSNQTILTEQDYNLSTASIEKLLNVYGLLHLDGNEFDDLHVFSDSLPLINDAEILSIQQQAITDNKTDENIKKTSNTNNKVENKQPNNTELTYQNSQIINEATNNSILSQNTLITSINNYGKIIKISFRCNTIEKTSNHCLSHVFSFLFKDSSDQEYTNLRNKLEKMTIAIKETDTIKLTCNITPYDKTIGDIFSENIDIFFDGLNVNIANKLNFYLNITKDYEYNLKTKLKLFIAIAFLIQRKCLSVSDIVRILKTYLNISVSRAIIQDLYYILEINVQTLYLCHYLFIHGALTHSSYENDIQNSTEITETLKTQLYIIVSKMKCRGIRHFLHSLYSTGILKTTLQYCNDEVKNFINDFENLIDSYTQECKELPNSTKENIFLENNNDNITLEQLKAIYEDYILKKIKNKIACF